MWLVLIMATNFLDLQTHVATRLNDLEVELRICRKTLFVLLISLTSRSSVMFVFLFCVRNCVADLFLSSFLAKMWSGCSWFTNSSSLSLVSSPAAIWSAQSLSPTLSSLPFQPPVQVAVLLADITHPTPFTERRLLWVYVPCISWRGMY